MSTPVEEVARNARARQQQLDDYHAKWGRTSHFVGRIRAEDVLANTTIVPTRYGGTYEGGEWVASAWTPPEEAFGSDPECSSWWTAEAQHWPVAVGAMPNEALDNLLDKLTVTADREQATRKE